MTHLRRKIVGSIAAVALALVAAPNAVAATNATDSAAPELFNVLEGKLPIGTNATLEFSGDDKILDEAFATDGDTSWGGTDKGITAILAGAENNNPPENGFSTWQDVYLAYDLGSEREISSVVLYHNGYEKSTTRFYNVKVDVSTRADFSDAKPLSPAATYEETMDNRYAPQTITPKAPVSGRYIRVWQKGQYIKNDPPSTWNSNSNKVAFREIQVMTPKLNTDVLPGKPQVHTENIALHKLPYVYGRTPTHLEKISDGQTGNGVAVHESRGRYLTWNGWRSVENDFFLQFDYRNTYTMKRVELDLVPGSYERIRVSVSTNPTDGTGTEIFKATNKEVTGPINIEVPAGVQGSHVRFTIYKGPNEPVKYNEVKIFAEGTNFDESAPAYVPPKSDYTNLVWSDEFNDSKIDESKWTIIEGMANHGAIYNRGAVDIAKDKDGSYLRINSRHYESTDALLKALKDRGQPWDRYGKQNLNTEKVLWSSGRIEAKNKFSFQYGRIAVRAKVNDSRGIWPAIWMLAQDATGHDEIDILEYLGQEWWNAYMTNHYGIWGFTKGSHSDHKSAFESWSQNFHVYEVEWTPKSITWYIDGKYQFSTSNGRGAPLDAMHRRSMFPILETQVGDGWVGNIDYKLQETKENTDFLVDWVRVYQKPDQPVTRFDDLAWGAGDTAGPAAAVAAAKPNELGETPLDPPYHLKPLSHTDGLQFLSDGEQAFQDKDNFYYGGQPRYETSRLAVKDGVRDPQSIIYSAKDVKDVHLTTYYQTKPENLGKQIDGGWVPYGQSTRTDAINFTLQWSTDGQAWQDVKWSKVFDNFVEPHPGFARVTFDAYDLPEGANFVKVNFPNLPAGMKATDVQLAKVTMLQAKNAALAPVPQPDVPTPDPQLPGGSNVAPTPNNPEVTPAPGDGHGSGDGQTGARAGKASVPQVEKLAYTGNSAVGLGLLAVSLMGAGAVMLRRRAS
ncbi:MAG: family 16 glycosylhydrolase [Arcanobacterium sp.]|nr:family 16 glycosylhydrolase [Arcanobacterium sp.]